VSEPILSLGDRRFVLRAMRTFGISKLNIEWSDSKKRFPDIWVNMSGKIPMITVTAEWARQDAQERHKRIVHEFLHLLGYEHGRIGQYLYSTYPDKDTFSKAVYQKLFVR